MSKGPIIFISTLTPVFIVQFIYYQNHKKINREWILGFLFSMLVLALIIFFWMLTLTHALKDIFAIKELFRTAASPLKNGNWGREFGITCLYPFLLTAPLSLWPLLWKVTFVEMKQFKKSNFGTTYVVYGFLIVSLIITCLPLRAERHFLTALPFAVLFFTHSLVSWGQRETNFKKYSNFPFIIGMLVLSTAVAIGFFYSKHLLQIESMTNAINWKFCFLLAVLIFITCLIFILQKKCSLVISIFQQFALVFLSIIFYLSIWGGITQAAHNTESLAQFLRKTHVPIAYLYNYTGYYYSANKNRGPSGDIVFNSTISKWYSAHPNGVIVYTISDQLPPKDALFLSFQGKKKYFYKDQIGTNKKYYVVRSIKDYLSFNRLSYL